MEDFRSDPLKFASLIAHQLRTPISTVSTSLHALLGEYAGPLSRRQRDSLEKANLRCQEALTSIKRLMAIVRAEDGETAPKERCPLIDVVRQVHLRYQDEAAGNDISLAMEAAVASVHVGIGDAMLAEILSAVVSNAMKFTPDRGRIRLSIDKADREDVVLVRVADSGAGIPEENQPLVFEPFFHTSPTRKARVPGIGLGLAFVRSVLRAAGGEARAGTSDLGGAEITLELPVVESDEHTEQASAGPSFRVVIVGGVAAGPKAAAKIIRLKPEADVTIVEKGSIMSYAGCGLPYYVSGLVDRQKDLISGPTGVVRDSVFFRAVKNVHVRNQAEAVEIDREGKRVRVRDGLTGWESWLAYDKLLLATGSSPVLPKALDTGLANIFMLHGVREAEGIKSALMGRKARDVVIVGGGLIGIEMTEALVAKGARVTIVERLPTILPMVDSEIALLVARYLEGRGVKILTETTAVGLEGDDGQVRAVVTNAGRCRADIVILALGVRPTTELAEQAGLEIGETRAIAVDEGLRTSDPDIYAAGDCAQTTHLVTGKPCYVPLGSTANKQGRVAAVNMCGGNDVFAGVAGTRICKIFDYTVARTGLGEAEAAQAGFEPVCVLAPGLDREHFMRPAGFLLLKLIVDRHSRRLLGVQAAGKAVADKRIDVASVAITAGMTVDQLANADLGYAPPYSTAMDNLITAANVARNKLDGNMISIMPADVQKKRETKEDFVFLDVRTPEEHEQIRLPGARLIPLGALRERMAELPKDSEIIVFCNISLRGYEASLILQAAGFRNVKVMEGGVEMWPYGRLR